MQKFLRVGAAKYWPVQVSTAGVNTVDKKKKKKLGLFNKSPLTIFFGGTNLESPFQHQYRIKKPREKESLKKRQKTQGDPD